ncbi:MAG TPA: VOC family protein [Acetobacteraceae bacterium]|nr:VOC family protein [Acetobacteraceae bacterium]
MVKSRPDGYPSLTPYLIVRDGAAAIAFYCQVLGARERLRMPGPGGRVGHAELEIGTSLVMLADEAPEHGAVAPGESAGRSVSLHLYVEDADATMQAARQRGARVIAELENKFYGDRLGSFIDPFGHAWHVATHIEDVSEDELRRRAAAVSGGA